jgi:hypothetical protein
MVLPVTSKHRSSLDFATTGCDITVWPSSGVRRRHETPECRFTARFTEDALRGTQVETRWCAGDAERVWSRNAVTTSSVLARRECISAAGPFDEELEAGSDYDMWLRMSKLCQLRYLDEPLVRYWIHGSQISTDYAKKARSTMRLVDKHQTLFERDRRSFSRRSMDIGIWHARSDNLGEARRAFRTSIRLAPLSWKPYVLLALSFVVPQGARR